MNFPFYIAKRYLFSKKSHNIINIISGISVAGVTVGTLALIVVLSVFNGFEELVKSLFNTFNPDLIITIKEGKTFNASNLPYEKIKNLPGVISFSEVVEENALLKYKTEQYIVTLKGVSNEFLKNNPLDTMLVDGDFILENNAYNFTVMGYLVAYNLGIKINDFSNPVHVYLPKRTKKRLTSLEQSFNSGSLIPSAVFSVQQEIDSKYVIVPIRFARKLLDYTNEVTSIEIRLDPNVDSDFIQQEIQNLAGDSFVVKNRFQQQELLYKIMKTEKWAIFIILSFILIIAVFNVVGSLSMLILDKRKDIAVLFSMGANEKLIKRIFLLEGLLISFSGAIFGLLLGYLLCILQLKYGFIKLGPDEGAFIIPYYPVKLYFADFVAVFTLVFFIGLVAAWFPVKQIADKYLKHSLSDNLKSQ
ncbi:MAG: FtsX-like permease family protein [Bacteroidales bacterium]|nr:FtsX-like permease family protein [Bacteroidales bacterium]